MTTTEAILPDFSNIRDRTQEISQRLPHVGKENLKKAFSVFLFHLEELHCIYTQFLRPEISKFYLEEGPSLSLPVKGYVALFNFDYKINIQIHALLKSYILISRMCLDDLLGIIVGLTKFLQKEHNGRYPPKDFNGFVKFVLSEDNNFDDRLALLLKQFLIDFVILRFIRNDLKKDGVLLFDLRFRNDAYHLNVKFVFEKIDPVLQLLVDKDSIELNGNTIFFDLDEWMEKSFNNIVVLHQVIIEILKEKIVVDNQIDSNTTDQITTQNKLSVNDRMENSTFEPGVFDDITLDRGTILIVRDLGDISKSEFDEILILIAEKPHGYLIAIYEKNSGIMWINHQIYGILSTLGCDVSRFVEKPFFLGITWDTYLKSMTVYMNDETIAETIMN